jgi:hypothetical protein
VFIALGVVIALISVALYFANSVGGGDHDHFYGDPSNNYFGNPGGSWVGGYGPFGGFSHF